jgi:hypothetical protein
MSHTPGPWRLQFLGAHEADLIHNGTFAGINGGSGCPDSLDGPDHATWETNARLIAKAPDLLSALEQIAAYEISDNLNYYNARRMIEIAREAIEKS